MNFRLARPAYPIDINAVAGLDRLAAEDGIPPIGALVRHADFEHPVDPGPVGSDVGRCGPACQAYPIQVRGTFCGSLADADPAAEWSLIAATLGAE